MMTPTYLAILYSMTSNRVIAPSLSVKPNASTKEGPVEALMEIYLSSCFDAF